MTAEQIGLGIAATSGAPPKDGDRLALSCTGQKSAILWALRDGQWRPADWIIEKIFEQRHRYVNPESAMADIRNLRKPPLCFNVESRRDSSGAWEYRLGRQPRD